MNKYQRNLFYKPPTLAQQLPGLIVAAALIAIYFFGA